MKRNIIYQWAYQILAILLPIITTPYISRVLGVENIGIFSYQFATANYFMLFAMLGVNTYGNRLVAQKKDNYKELCVAFSEVYYAQVITSVVVGIIYVLYMINWSKYPIIAMIQFIYVLGCAFDINWLFFGLEKFKITVTRNFVVKIVTVVLIFLLVKSSDDLNKYVFIMALGTVISQSIMWCSIRGYVRLEKVALRQVLSHYKGLLVLFIPAIALSAYKYLAKIMIGSISTIEEVGYYENAEKIINLLLTFLTSVGTVMLPRMSNLIANGKTEQVKKYIDMSMTIIMYIAIGAAFGIMAVSEQFIPVFLGAGYERSIGVLSILAFSIIFSAAAQIIRTQYLIPQNMDVGYSVSLVCGAIVSVLINLILIRYTGAIGAAIGTLCAEAVVCIIQFILARRELNIVSYLKQIGVYILMATAMCLVVVKINVENLFISLIAKVLVGIVIYGVLGILMWRISTVRKQR